MNATLMELYSAREQLCKLHERIAESDDPEEMRSITQKDAAVLKERIVGLQGVLKADTRINVGGDDHEGI